MKDRYDIVIAGSGPAGLTAAIYCARAGLSTLVIAEEGGPGGQMRLAKSIENYPGIESISGAELGERLLAHAKAVGAEVVEDEVVSLGASGKTRQVLTRRGFCEAGAVIVALGARKKSADIPGEAEFLGRGVSYCATCDGAFFRRKITVVAGGGPVAVEDTLYLAGLCERVYLLCPEARPHAGAEELGQLDKAPNVTLVPNVKLARIEGGDFVSAAVARDAAGNETRYDVAGVFLAMGAAPQSTVLAGLVDLDEKGFARAPENGETKTPGVYVAGDIRHKALRQVVTATADGANAALAAQFYVKKMKAAASAAG